VENLGRFGGTAHHRDEKLPKLKVMQTERGCDAPAWAVPRPLYGVLSCFTVQASPLALSHVVVLIASPASIRHAEEFDLAVLPGHSSSEVKPSFVPARLHNLRLQVRSPRSP
jgi:hypothetical protein